MLLPFGALPLYSSMTQNHGILKHVHRYVRITCIPRQIRLGDAFPWQNSGISLYIPGCDLLIGHEISEKHIRAIKTRLSTRKERSFLQRAAMSWLFYVDCNLRAVMLFTCCNPIFVRANTRQFSIRSCPTENWGSSQFSLFLPSTILPRQCGKLGSQVPRLQSRTCSCVMGSWPLLPCILVFVLYVWYVMSNMVTSVGTPEKGAHKTIKQLCPRRDWTPSKRLKGHGRIKARGMSPTVPGKQMENWKRFQDW